MRAGTVLEPTATQMIKRDRALTGRVKMVRGGCVMLPAAVIVTFTPKQVRVPAATPASTTADVRTETGKLTLNQSLVIPVLPVGGVQIMAGTVLEP